MDTNASDIMTRNVQTMKVGTSLEEVLKMLVNRKITGMPVVDAAGKMVGVVSEYDVLKQISSAKKLSHQAFQEPAEFTHSVDAVDEATPLNDIAERFVKAKYRRLPVVDSKGKLLGIITRRDLMRLYYYRAKLS